MIVGSYYGASDNVVDDVFTPLFPHQRSEPESNPNAGGCKYPRSHREFERNRQIDHALLISVALHGYLRWLL